MNSSADLTILGNVNTGPLNKTGPGTLTLGGGGDNSGLALNVLQGTVIFAKVGAASGHAVGGGGVTVSPGALLQLASSTNYGGQIYARATINGTFDLNGRNEGVTGLLGTGIGHQQLQWHHQHADVRLCSRRHYRRKRHLPRYPCPTAREFWPLP